MGIGDRVTILNGEFAGEEGEIVSIAPQIVILLDSGEFYYPPSVYDFTPNKEYEDD